MPVGSLGETNSSAKLTKRIVEIIRSMHYVQGFGPTEIARRLELPRSTVRDVVNHKTWTHV